jgi:hypothetical protein
MELESDTMNPFPSKSLPNIKFNRATGAATKLPRISCTLESALSHAPRSATVAKDFYNDFIMMKVQKADLVVNRRESNQKL